MEKDVSTIAKFEGEASLSLRTIGGPAFAAGDDTVHAGRIRELLAES